MSLLQSLLDAFSKWSPIKIEVSLPNLKELNIGNRTYKVDNGYLIVGEDKIKIEKDKEGILQLRYNATELSALSEDRQKNIKLLDEEEKVFTRADISELQLGFLSTEEKHEQIIEKLRPVLLGYRNNRDLGSLLVASTMIKHEDERKNEKLIKDYSAKLGTSYKKVGRMVYNLFRSGILESEIIPHLEKLEKIYPQFEDVRKNFLIYWYSIIQDGYPTAYFIQFWDSDITVFNQIDWRLSMGSSYVDVYSRGTKRNKLTERWCKIFCEEENCQMESPKKYQLGFTPAMKIRIRPS